MFSFINRMDANLFKRALVFALAGALLSGILAPATVAARDAKRPYIIPGDADEPAGVQGAVLINDRAGGDAVPLFLSLGPWRSGLLVLWVDCSARVVRLGLAPAEADAPADSKR